MICKKLVKDYEKQTKVETVSHETQAFLKVTVRN